MNLSLPSRGKKKEERSRAGGCLIMKGGLFWVQLIEWALLDMKCLLQVHVLNTWSPSDSPILNPS